MSSATKQFTVLMKILSIVYLVAGLAFFFFPNELFYLINVGPKVFKAFEDIPLQTEKFWLSLTTSMMVMLFLCASLSASNPKTLGYTFIHLASKATSVAAFLFLFFHERKFFAYLLGAMIDGGIFLIVLMLFIRSSFSKPPAVPPPAPNLNEPR